MAANRVAELRRAAGLSQRALAREIGYSHSLVADIERNRQPMSETMAYRLAKRFGCSPFELFARPQLRALPTAYDGAEVNRRIAINTDRKEG